VRLALAGKLAEDHNAHIVSLAVRQTQVYPMGFVEVIPQHVINSISAQTEEAIDALCNSFRVAMAASGVNANSQLRDATGGPAQQISVHGRYNNLIFIGQPDPDLQSGLATELADDVILQAERLIFFISYTQRETKIGKPIMVAWNGSREAARAVADVMPLLKRAASTDILSTNPDGIGDELLNRAADRNIDMLVMGGYGHSRFREVALGGATRHILRHMTVPTFLSH